MHILRLQSLAEANAVIAERRLEVAAGIQRVSALIKEMSEKSEQLDADFKELKGRVEHAGTTSTTGLLLRKKRSELPRDKEFIKRAQFVQKTMPDAHLTLMEWKRQRSEVADPEEAANAIVSSIATQHGEVDALQVQQIVIRLLEDRRSLLDKAIPDQDTYLQDLNQLELSNQTLRAQVAEFRQYLNQRVLWIRSTNLISINDLQEARSGLSKILETERWQESMRVGGVAVLKRPAVGVGLIALLALLIMFRARLNKTQMDLLEKPADGPIQFRRYFGSFLITCLLSIRWPALLLAIGYRLRMTATDGSWTASVGDALLTSVVFLWGCELIRELCRKDCVGEKAFGWPSKATANVRNTLELTALLGTPLFALLQLTQFGELDGMQSLQRLLFIAVLTLFGVQIGWLTRPQGRLMLCLHESSSDSIVYRARHAVWIVLTAAPLALAILSVVGFHFSAYQLSGRLAETGAVIVCMILLYSLGLCWLNVVSFNRAFSLADHQEISESPTPDRIETAAAETETAVVDQPVSHEGPEFHTAADDEVRDLLRYACWIVMIAGGWFIWSDVLPALRMFDHVVLWQNIESVPETSVDGNGIESVQFVDHTVPTTLTDLMVAMLICVATLMIGRRLPGVLQLVVLERLPIQPGGRQAIGILTRYVATVAGLLLACSVIRLSWSSVQWLAAAMTVGLGFGLQEIFANLVSGLIILGERPIRVGDVVTVGDVTGTVTRMQMRATTVTDYDRRELIVPNKKFITDNVINWTLSDPISRVVLPVGVAYGTEIEQVRRILLSIAASCPYVLDEPAPNTLFKGFGDSTLDMQLMVFIPQRSVYVDVVNELNGAIAKQFAEADIEIAFPQLDLHVQAVEPEAAIPKLSEVDAKAA